VERAKGQKGGDRPVLHFLPYSLEFFQTFGWLKVTRLYLLLF